MELAVVIPTLNAERDLARLLGALGDAPDRVVVSDGGSQDGTLRAALRRGALISMGGPGRGHQLRRGCDFALRTLGDDAWILALHADTRLPDGWHDTVRGYMAEGSARAAHFRYGADGNRVERAVLGAMVRLREIAWGLPYGDQGLLISARLYREIGGYHDMVLFEDVDIVTRLRRHHGRLARLPGEVSTDISAYRREGLLRRGVRNLRLLSAYRSGEDVDALAERYRTRTRLLQDG